MAVPEAHKPPRERPECLGDGPPPGPLPPFTLHPSAIYHPSNAGPARAGQPRSRVKKFMAVVFWVPETPAAFQTAGPGLLAALPSLDGDIGPRGL